MVSVQVAPQLGDFSTLQASDVSALVARSAHRVEDTLTTGRRQPIEIQGHLGHNYNFHTL